MKIEDFDEEMSMIIVVTKNKIRIPNVLINGDSGVYIMTNVESGASMIDKNLGDKHRTSKEDDSSLR